MVAYKFRTYKYAQSYSFAGNFPVGQILIFFADRNPSNYCSEISG